MEQVTSDLVGQRNQRILKSKKLTEIGINPYPSDIKKDILNNEITNNFSSNKDKEYWVAGRIKSWRNIGKIIFSDLFDDSGKIQLYIKQEVLEKTNISQQTLGWEHMDLFDIGDFVSAFGKVTKTKTGEISILVSKIQIATKSLRPLPDKWHGLEDKDERFRRRYLDMTMNSEIRERFKRRSLFWKNIRKYLDDNGFHEINIPVLEHVTGGADAKPFTTHYDSLGQDLYLRISHELPLKRLIGGGFEKVYDIGPRFRNEGVDADHLPEHVAMEFYSAYMGFEDGIKFTQKMYQYVLSNTFNKMIFEYEGKKVDISGNWVCRKYEDLLSEFYGKIDIYNDDIDSLIKLYRKHGGKSDDLNNRLRVVDSLWKIVRGTIIGPMFVTHDPIFISPLAKKSDELRTLRFHPIILGTEMGNAFSELNDPIDQLIRFKEQQDLRDSGDEEAQMLDIDFVEMLEYGMPPTFGFGLSERVFWTFEGVSAKEGVPFPHLKRDISETTKKIYDLK